MKWIKPSKVDGKIQAPPSKSMMIRAAAAGLLSDGETRIINPSYCDDALASIGIAQSLGANLESINQGIKIIGGNGPVGTTYLDCGESGLCMRMFTPVAAIFKEEVILEGSGSLLSRPIGEVELPISQLGGDCRTSDRNRPPIKVRGPLRGGDVHIIGSLSSQFLTGLLMALPRCENDSEVFVSNLRSKPYIAMTLSLLSDFGIGIEHDDDFSQFFVCGSQQYMSRDYSVEGDWSGASFYLVAGAIGGCSRIQGLSLQTHQADRKILEALELAGAKIRIDDNLVVVEQNRLQAFEFVATQCPDLFPPLVVLACACQGQSVIHGVTRLRFKESDRAESLLSEFRKIGARIEIENDKMIIEGGSLEGGSIRSRGDHRIAMAAAVAGLVSRKGVIIDDWQCVSKSYPGFFDVLESVSRR
jgi:3-phosphoshikimate 1-carboxyvinyltransferase